jgi:hypothetical protein
MHVSRVYGTLRRTHRKCMDTTQDDLSNVELKAGYWYITHRKLIGRIIFIGLIALNIFLWGWALIVGAIYLVRERPATVRAEQAINERRVDTSAITLAADVDVADVQVFGAGGGRYDFYARLVNPNPRHRASFTYAFFHDGGTTKTQTGYIHPGREIILHALGQELTRNPGSAQLLVNDLRFTIEPAWERVERERLALTLSDVRATPLVTGSGMAVHYLLENTTSYGYHSIDIPVLLYRGSRVVGVNTLALEQVEAGDRRDITMQWFDATTSANSVTVHPQVNIFDTSVYRRLPEGASVGR